MKKLIKVYHLVDFKNYPEGRVECVKKFETEKEASEYIEKDKNVQMRVFGEVIDKMFIGK